MAEKKSKLGPRKPPASVILVAPKALASLFIAASVGRLSHLFPRWMSKMVESKYEITSSQLMLMFLLSQSEKITMGQLAEMLDLTPRAITGIVDALTKKKYVARSQDASDHRVTWIHINAEGKNFLKSARPDIATKLGDLLGVLTRKEQVELVRLIEKLTDHMKKQIDE
ncbi:MAG: MarR family transcriptional regulator [Actinobacteria bacterium]|nr:MarR family transcriptional regulator [Actinomycetota bacterium]